MKVVFADTFYFLALAYPRDQHHKRTVQLADNLRVRYLTSDWIITEVADALSKGRARAQVEKLICHIRFSSVWEVVHFSENVFERALEFHSLHHDKEWTLTDCASFVIMGERGITEALTGDHHFEQAGFTALLK
jgi:predicted nucleic acid-binding protein